ncbi:ATP-binding protein, partial [Patescibacteria group bacterium]|nr:ATP-binding protein [Patescibacteria group bacterium]
KVHQKKMPIEYLEIQGLHGSKNIKIKFKSSNLILVGENGSGKTTLLNILFFVLTKKWLKLSRINFKKVLIKFPDKLLEIDSQLLLTTYAPGLIDLFEGKLNNDDLLRIFHYSQTRPPGSFRNYLKRISFEKNLDIPFSELVEIFDEGHFSLKGRNLYTKKVKEIEEIIDENYKLKTLYFPTYRRVEEDFNNLILSSHGEYKRYEQLINFGMQDVHESFNNITREIKDSYTEWFSIITSRMLSQMINNIDSSLIDYKSILDKETLSIVLDRVGNEIGESEKMIIIHLVESKKIKEKSHIYLAYFLQNLIKVYENQRENDDSIKNFTRIVNNYLVDKEVSYDERKVEISITNKSTGKTVELNNLSSGEKQIVSIFSKLYLEKISDVSFFIDEPELSLSIDWQRRFLLDISKSPKVKLLIATTHSPFIFENELDKFAEPLGKY